MLPAYDDATLWTTVRSSRPMPIADPLRARIARAWHHLREQDGDLGVPLETFTAHVEAAVRERSGDDEEKALAVVDRLVLRDVYLVLGCLAGHPAALRLFDDRFRGYLRALSRRYAPHAQLAEDIEAEMLCTLFQPREADGAGEPRLAAYRGMGTLQGWLRVALRRLAIDMARSRAHRPTATAEGDGEIVRVVGAGPDVAERLAAHDAVERLRPLLDDCVAELDPAQRDLMRLYYRDGWVLRELAARLGCDIATVHRRLAAIRKRIWTGLTRRARQRLGLDERDLRRLVGELADAVDLDALFATALFLVVAGDLR